MTESYRLGGVDFASDVAREEAMAAGLTSEDFRGVETDRPTGISVALVREIIALRRDRIVVDPAPPQTMSEAERAGYTISSWMGHTSYHCLQCPFGTLDQEEVERHARRHRAAR